MKTFDQEKAIGILDSGVGGITVTKEVMRQLPKETVYYFGDTKRLPYGPRPKEQVAQFTEEIIRFLHQFPLKAILIACNTATAAALIQMQQTFSLPIIGVIEPGARAAIKTSRKGRIGVIGTEGTIGSRAYERALKRLNPHMEVYSLACPEFVPLVEQGLRHTSYAYTKVQQQLQPFKERDLDTLVLGCTHYPLLTKPIQKCLGSDVKIISSAEETAAELSTILQHQDLLSSSLQTAHRFFTTGDVNRFAELAGEWLEQEIEVEHVELTEQQELVW